MRYEPSQLVVATLLGSVIYRVFHVVVFTVREWKLVHLDFVPMHSGYGGHFA